MTIDDLDKNSLVLKVAYDGYEVGEACFISQKGNICLTEYDGKMLFSRQQIERNPDLLDIFFYVQVKNPFNASEKAFLKPLLDNYHFPLTAKFSVDKTQIFFDIEFKYININDKSGRLLLKLWLNNHELFKDKPLNDYEHTIAELGNLLY